MTLTVRASRQTLRRYSSVSTANARFAAPSLSFYEPHRARSRSRCNLRRCQPSDVNAVDRNTGISSVLPLKLLCCRKGRVL